MTKDTKELIGLYKKITGNTDVKIEGIMNFVLTSKDKCDIIYKKKGNLYYVRCRIYIKRNQ